MGNLSIQQDLKLAKKKTITYSDTKTGKPISQKTLDNWGPVKKHSKPKIIKEGKIYRIANHKYEAGK
tara:strand:+ start:434 stop:634 length:201 start_codon:yes stop_codon:yes gene_type:complete